MAGFALLIAAPSLDLEWEHRPSHFGLILAVAVLNMVLGLLTSEAAHQRDDARLFLVSMALLASSGFLALHALATPGVVLAEPNAGFTIATPVGLLLASVFAAASGIDLDRRLAPGPRGWRLALRAVLVTLLVGWAAASLSGLTPLARAPEEERVGWVLWLLPAGVAAYALRYLELYRVRRRPLPLAVAVAFVLLAEALVAVAFSRAWHTSWWEWHVLMAIAFGAILIASRREYRRERSFGGAFGGLYLERTLEHVDRRDRAALGELVAAVRDAEPLDQITDRLRGRGFTGDEVAILQRAARELSRVDGLLRRYVGPRLAEELHREPDFDRLGGRERQITALFADLAGFTTFSEDRNAAAVIEMLNSCWEAVVPAVVEEEGGLIERFAGDAILAVFNALGDQPDHELRAARAAIGIRERTEYLRAGRAIGLGSGWA
jgi:adenylate cyclase